MRHFHLISWKTVWFGSVSSEHRTSVGQSKDSNIPFTAIARCSSDERNTEAKSWEILVTWNALNWNCKLVAHQVANWWRTLSPLYKAPNQFWVSDTNISGFVRCSDFQPSLTFSDFLWKIPSYVPLKKTAPPQGGSFFRLTFKSVGESD